MKKSGFPCRKTCLQTEHMKDDVFAKTPMVKDFSQLEEKKF